MNRVSALPAAKDQVDPGPRAAAPPRDAGSGQSHGRPASSALDGCARRSSASLGPVL